jgi:NAD-dependent deacetylase sirtuin 5
VHPAAGFIKTVKDRGGIVAVFNTEPSAADAYADFVFMGPCEELLPQVLQVFV